MSSPDQTSVSWRKSSYSAGNNGDCVEVSQLGSVRDSKNPAGGRLAFGWSSLGAFVTAVKVGQFDA